MIKICHIDEVKHATFGKFAKDVEQFNESGADCAEVLLDGSIKNSAYSSLNACIKRRGYNIRVVGRCGRIFLVRNDAK